MGTASLDLYSEPDMQLRSTDPDARDLIISCGAALHHCVVALAAMGWQAKVNRFPDPDDPRHLAAIEVQPHIPDRADIALAAAIARRRTDRRAYSSWPVAGGDIALMAARAARSGVMLRQVDALDRMKAIVAQAVSDDATNHDYLHELTTWSGRYGWVAGVPARNAPPADSYAGEFEDHRIVVAPVDGGGPFGHLATARALIHPKRSNEGLRAMWLGTKAS